MNLNLTVFLILYSAQSSMPSPQSPDTTSTLAIPEYSHPLRKYTYWRSDSEKCDTRGGATWKV